jgi:hypothetical protein
VRVLEDALRAGAAGLYCAEAGAGLLIRQRSWLSGSDFAPFIVIAADAGGQPATAAVDWEAAITALDGGVLPCSALLTELPGIVAVQEPERSWQRAVVPSGMS